MECIHACFSKHLLRLTKHPLQILLVSAPASARTLDTCRLHSLIWSARSFSQDQAVTLMFLRRCTETAEQVRENLKSFWLMVIVRYLHRAPSRQSRCYYHRSPNTFSI